MRHLGVSMFCDQVYGEGGNTSLRAATDLPQMVYAETTNPSPYSPVSKIKMI